MVSECVVLSGIGKKPWKGVDGRLAENSVAEWSDACSGLGLSLLPWAWDAATNPGLRKGPATSGRRSGGRVPDTGRKTTAWECGDKLLILPN